jgi:hypothetical protein
LVLLARFPFTPAPTGYGLPAGLKAVGCQTGVGFCPEAGGDHAAAHVLAGFLAPGRAGVSDLDLDFKPSARRVEW